ncbi:MAG: DUF3179 domain-containing protein [Rhizobiaceae bacterium]|nr:DUF3179 domain-containing protein [Rhizobiaceae bacterium]
MRIIRLLFAIMLVCVATSGLAQESRWKAEGWRTDFTKSSVDFAEILSGGPPKDGIPPIDNPKFEAVSKTSNLIDREPVIGLSINGDARAYPLRVLTWHEIVNDTVGGQPVAVTYCPLCNVAIVFDARLDGETLSFGTTGKLRHSDLIMYDRKTESWWQQFVGESIVGHHLGKKLKLVPAHLESWLDFRTRHPEGKVLVPNNANMRPYGRNPYVNYDIAATPFLYRGSMPEGISPMARVVVVRRSGGEGGGEGDGGGGEEPIVVALELLRKSAIMKVGSVQLSWKTGQASALHTSDIAKGRDVGTVSVTQISDGADLAYDVTFAFVAHAFHPKAEIRR